LKYYEDWNVIKSVGQVEVEYSVKSCFYDVAKGNCYEYYRLKNI